MAQRIPAEGFPPGDYLQDWLDLRNWTQTELAEVMGRPVPLINQIIRGKSGITAETARELAAALGTSAEYWINLDGAYKLSKVRQPDDAIARRRRIYSKTPVKELIRRNWIEPSDSVDVLEARVANFLGVDSIDDDPIVFAHAARKSTPYESVSPAHVAWLRRAQLLAVTLDVPPYSRSQFDSTIRELKTLLHDAREARHVPRVLADAGIRFIVIEQTSGSKIDGACFWLDSNSPVLAVSLRYDRLDNFWHTVFHELGHIRSKDGLNKHATLDVDLYAKSTSDKPDHEKRADEFAVGTLAPQDELDDFIERVSPMYSKRQIVGFSLIHKLHPSIVIGQLHHREELQYSQLRSFLVKVRDIVTSSALTDGWGHWVPAL